VDELLEVARLKRIWQITNGCLVIVVIGYRPGYRPVIALTGANGTTGTLRLSGNLGGELLGVS
jgi:hypothetical protein